MGVPALIPSFVPYDTLSLMGDNLLFWAVSFLGVAVLFFALFALVGYFCNDKKK